MAGLYDPADMDPSLVFPPAPRQSYGGLGGLGGIPWQAIGMSLMSSPRNAPLANFGQYQLAFQKQARDEEEQQRQMAEQQAAAAKENQSLQYLRSEFPDIAKFVDAGLPIRDAFDLAMGQKGQGLINAGDGQLYDPNTGQWISAPNAGGDEYSQRATAAGQYGLSPDDPGYESFILTGKMPREDAQPLTATDKKAILEADEMVAVNEAAIKALQEAEGLSDQANAGWFAGSRASIGNNLPDLMVPDFVSSPESSAATTNYDNAVVGQALTQLKAIFGGAPTEGERKVLLDLQGSSSQPANVRKEILGRAIRMAQARLSFNRKRADELRGGEFYKPGGGVSTPSAPTPSPELTAPAATGSGVKWRIVE